MTEFRPVHIKEYPGLKEGADPESSYWRKFSKQILRKEIAPVSHVEFAVSQPHLLAYTSSTRVPVVCIIGANLLSRLRSLTRRPTR